jgi:branched-chain amino acid transport system permease protein
MRLGKRPDPDEAARSGRTGSAGSTGDQGELTVFALAGDGGGSVDVAIDRRQRVLVRGTPMWRAVMIGLTAAALVAVLVPVFVLPPIEARLITRFVALGIGLLGLQFVVGVAGQLSLCHGVFVGVGSYTVTIVTTVHGWPHLAGVAAAPVAGFALGLVVGLLALRIRATYLGPVTLAVAVAFPMVVKRFSWLTGGSSGLPLVRRLPSPSWLGVTDQNAYRWHHVVIVAVAISALVVARNLVGSPVGLAVRAVAQNEIAASASGVNVRRTKLVAYAVGAAFGALGGALLVLDTPIVGADSYDLFRSLGYYAAVVVGGMASLGGAFVGAGLLVGVPWTISVYDVRLGPNLVYGALLLASIFVAPGGIVAALLSRLADVVIVCNPVDQPPDSVSGGQAAE